MQSNTRSKKQKFYFGYSGVKKVDYVVVKKEKMPNITQKDVYKFSKLKHGKHDKVFQVSLSSRLNFFTFLVLGPQGKSYALMDFLSFFIK